MATNKKGI